MIAYHGTNINSANNIVGPPPNIDVTRGGGELGQGFYVGDNIALAVSLAKGRHNANAAVIKFEIDDHQYVQLNTKILGRRHYVWSQWRSIVRSRLANSYLFNVDVICAPFATLDFSHQYKFESIAAQTVLNNSNKEILL